MPAVEPVDRVSVFVYHPSTIDALPPHASRYSASAASCADERSASLSPVTGVLRTRFADAGVPAPPPAIPAGVPAILPLPRPLPRPEPGAELAPDGGPSMSESARFRPPPRPRPRPRPRPPPDGGPIVPSFSGARIAPLNVFSNSRSDSFAAWWHWLFGS